MSRLGDIDWQAVAAYDWSDRETKERKQSEFLLENRFPWHLVHRIGVMTESIARQTANALPAEAHRPAVEIRPDWYY